MLHQPLMTEFVQIFPGSIVFRNIKFRQLGHAELDLHMTALSDLPGVFQGFFCIRKKCLHLLCRFYIILSALVAHPVFILQFFSGLQTKQDIMCRRILCVGIMDIIGRHQADTQLFAHP